MDESTPSTGDHRGRRGSPSIEPESEGRGLEEVFRALRDPRTDAATILGILEDRRWQAYYKVRQTIVFRPDAPLFISMRLLTTLWWRDLARVVEDLRLYPPVRARAEQLLAEKTEEMSPGERISLARFASRGLLKSLGESRDPRVVGALLCNPRLYEEDVLLIAGNEDAPAAVLSAVARSERWGGNHLVKLALTQNPKCPVADSLRSLRGMPANDLRRIAENPGTPRLVRIGAHRRLSED